MRHFHRVPLRNSAASSALNPTLRRLIERRIGPVRLGMPGVAAKFGKPALVGKHRTPAATMAVGYTGEYYRTTCPFCSDQNFRLYIHHLYMTPDPVNGRPMRHLAVCFNENCLERKAKELEAILFGIATDVVEIPTMRIGKGRLQTAEEVAPKPAGVELPLAGLDPTHQACRYLAGRGFDPARLGKVWGVTFCVQGDVHYPATTGRIIVPIHFRGEFRGWQARYPDDIDWKKAQIQKYYNFPGMPKTQYLYNYDRARRHRVAVVCEGVTDAWSVGGRHGVSIFGKRFSPSQLACLRRGWGAGDLCLVALDPDAVHSDKENERAAYAASMDTLRSVFGRRLIEVELPGCDPGSMAREAFWDVAASACGAAGVRLAKYKEA